MAALPTKHAAHMSRPLMQVYESSIVYQAFQAKGVPSSRKPYGSRVSAPNKYI